jgi:transcription-repair coupling factor (superfamily II helicase)
MRDLEIRGAGNILGSQQHGHMDNVGYDMYCKILSESISEAKGIKTKESQDVTIDININAYIPETYIDSANQRINMYKRISAIETEEDELEITDELIDRYGDMPKPVMNIISVASLKIDAREVGCIEVLQRGQLILKFAPDRLTPEVVFGIDDKFRGRVKVLSEQTPSLSVRLTEKDGNILQFVKKLLILIKELQNPKK